MNRIVVSLAAGLAVGGVLVAAPPATGTDGLTVTVASGTLRGVADGPSLEWRGVPYAAPPVGALRWRPPTPVPTWSGVRPAEEFASQCAQPGREAPVEGSEDCLYLNVFTHSGTTSGAGLPVMVHLHGGSNWFGASYRNADAFTSRGVIVVTVGYRLGVFGFTGHAALSAEGGGSSGEYGILDQIAALRWVQANIAAFGGDPANVTLFGESAGSFDAVAIAASPLGRGLFARLAAQTESVFALRGLGTIEGAEQLGIDVSQKVGCSPRSGDVAACLRSTSADQLVLASGAQDEVPWVGGAVLPASPLELISAQADPVPMLLGSNREEAAFFAFDQILGLSPYLPAYWVRDTDALVGPQHGDEVRALYPPGEYDSKLWAAVAAGSDAVYTCPMRQLARAATGKVFRYLYTHVLANDPVLAALRASHFLDEPLLWSDGELLAGPEGSYQFSSDELVLADRMGSYWTNFAKTGDPNGPGLPPWPQYATSTSTGPIAVLDEPGGQLDGYHDAQCDFFDALPVAFQKPNTYAPGYIR